jgi:hypothetical protein
MPDRSDGRLSPIGSVSYAPSTEPEMTWHQALKAAYQIPCYCSAVILAAGVARALAIELFGWVTGQTES